MLKTIQVNGRFVALSESNHEFLVDSLSQATPFSPRIADALTNTHEAQPIARIVTRLRNLGIDVPESAVVEVSDL